MRIAAPLRTIGDGFRPHELLSLALFVLVFLLPVAVQAGPTVTGVVNNYSFNPSGFANSGVVPSSIIAIFGSGLANAPAGTLTLESSAGPAGIPTSLNGAMVSVTVGGKTVTPAMYFAIPTQIAAVLPANTPIGTGTLTVTYNSVASNSFPIAVVSSALGLDTYYGTGKGLITATNASTGALFNYTNSASPGQTITLWGTGLGADPEDSDTVFTSTPHAVNQSSVQVYFGGVPGTVTYAGSSGYPGLDQINVVVPDPVGCNVVVTAVVGNIASNFPTAPLAQGGGECSDPLYGTTGSGLSTLSVFANVSSGVVFVSQTITTTSSGAQQTAGLAEADFQQFKNFTSSAVSVGGCIVNEGSSTGTSTGIDVETVTISSPAGAFPLTEGEPGEYAALLPDGATSPGATFTFNSTGAAGSITVSGIALPNPFLVWTNESTSATVSRSQGINVSWTGGQPGSFVIISGASSPPSSPGAPGGPAASFTCYAPQSALAFTVPAYITNLLPAGTGTLGLVDNTPYIHFTAPGIDTATAFGSNGNGMNGVKYQ